MTVSIRRAIRMEPWTWLAGVAVLTACVGHPSGDLRLPSEQPDRRIAAVPGGGGSPLSGTYGTSAAVLPSDGTRHDALPARGVNRSGSDMTAALDAVPQLSDRDVDSGRSYLIPAVEIVSFEALLNLYDRNVISHDVYATNSTSIRRNLHRGWVIDEDSFSMNQLGHPYTGSIYHGFARSAGLGYWEALGFDLAGAALWEIAGETGAPSLNDGITTTFAGSFLGEALYRTANLVLGGGDGRPGAGRSAIAGVISPSAGINRLAFGDRFDAATPDDDPPVFHSFGIGARRNATLDDAGALSDFSRNQGVAAFAIDYGQPGREGYTYTRPFDYYHLEATATSSLDAFPESLLVRGLLYGSEYTSGPDFHGIWGLYGSYDYFSPDIFKVSSTAVSLGTTAQVLMSDDLALQGTCTGGIGFTAAGNNTDRSRDREYHYSAGPQALLALRLIYSDVAMLDLTANDYILSGGTASGAASGSEDIYRARFALTVRVYGGHAVGIQFVESSRDPHFSNIPNPRQSVGAVSIFYTFLSDESFGVVHD